MKDKYEPLGYKISINEISKCSVWWASWFNSEAKNDLWQWNVRVHVKGSFATKHLKLKDYKSARESVENMCESLIEHGYVSDYR